MTTELKQLTKKIHKHCPELMNLTNGCRAYDAKAIDWARDLVLLTYTPKGHVYFMEPDGSVFHATSSYLKQIEILGHPITLEHVLKAIDARPLGMWEEYMVEEDNPNEWENLVERVVGEWNLTKPLHEQSPEVIKWLNTIIT